MGSFDCVLVVSGLMELCAEGMWCDGSARVAVVV